MITATEAKKMTKSRPRVSLLDAHRIFNSAQSAVEEAVKNGSEWTCLFYDAPNTFYESIEDFKTAVAADIIEVFEDLGYGVIASYFYGINHEYVCKIYLSWEED